MISFTRKLDGTGRPARQVQLDGLEWLATDWDKSSVSAINGPVGCGKSLMARAIQLETAAWVIPPSNILMDQVIATYPRVNFLKGKSHYRCSSGLTCAEWVDQLEQEPCMDCPYREAKQRAKAGEPTFFNPMSLYYLLKQTNLRPAVMVVDEAHQLPQMLLALCSKRFPKSIYNFTDKCQNEVYLIQWLGEQIVKLGKLVALYQNTGTYKEVSKILQEIESCAMTKLGLEADPHNYAIYFSQETYRGRPETFLNVRPIKTPTIVTRQLLNCDKLVLLSGSLFQTDIDELAAGKSYRYLDLPSPIPKERRPLLYRPLPYPVNYKTDPKRLVASIERILDEFPGRNTIIHTTYDRVRKWLPYFKREVIATTTPEGKLEALERFKREGGVFLAAGCAEGLDLRDDLCRLNIIPHLIRPNLADPVVAKRRALDDGDRWLAIEAIKTAMQQHGRSTRHERDSSICVMLDPTFGSTVQRYRDYIPRYFLESIQWQGQLPTDHDS